jgi:hypothetical protein
VSDLLDYVIQSEVTLPLSDAVGADDFPAFDLHRVPALGAGDFDFSGDLVGGVAEAVFDHRPDFLGDLHGLSGGIGVLMLAIPFHLLIERGAALWRLIFPVAMMVFQGEGNALPSRPIWVKVGV